MITNTQTKLVQRSFRHLALQYTEVAELFYDHLFQVDPGMRIRLGNRSRSEYVTFMHRLALLVKSLDDPSELQQLLTDFQNRSETVFAQSPQYMSSLLWAVEQVLGARYTPILADAWKQAIVTIEASASVLRQRQSNV